MLDEGRDPVRATAGGVEDEPALALPQSVLEGVEVETQPQEQVPILQRGLFDEVRTFGHC